MFGDGFCIRRFRITNQKRQGRSTRPGILAICLFAVQDPQDPDDIGFAFEEHPEIADAKAPDGRIYSSELDKVTPTGLGEAEDVAVDPTGSSLIESAYLVMAAVGPDHRDHEERSRSICAWGWIRPAATSARASAMASITSSSVKPTGAEARASSTV